MAQRVLVTLRSLAQETSTVQPVFYYLDERRRRTHRLAIYKPDELLLHNELAFVGFVSGKLKPLRPSIAADLRIMDKKLVAELVTHARSAELLLTGATGRELVQSRFAQ